MNCLGMQTVRNVDISEAFKYSIHVDNYCIKRNALSAHTFYFVLVLKLSLSSRQLFIKAVYIMFVATPRATCN